MKRITIERVQAVIEKPIKDARITGLRQWEGRIVTIIITAEGESDG
jgi:hypothetical protein